MIAMNDMNWISVKDRLPKESGCYLVNICDDDNGGIVLMAWFNANVNNINIVNGFTGWQLLNEFYDFTNQMRENITHWMPFPEPVNV